MKILVVHNRYHYRGGEDSVVDAEVALLRAHGHQVLIYSRDNNEVPELPKAGAALAAIWSRQTEREIRQIAIDFAPEVIHAHNTFPLISPSLYAVAARLRIPVVQTLHNQIDVYGTGPLQNFVVQSGVLRYCGFQSPEALSGHLHQAAYLVVPSTGMESFGLVAVEAFSCGTPVIATRHGGLAELVVHGKTGLLVPPGDASALAQAIAWAASHPEEMQQMGRAAYAEYLARYTPQHNYASLLRIYREAVADTLPLGLNDPNYAENRASR